MSRHADWPLAIRAVRASSTFVAVVSMVGTASAQRDSRLVSVTPTLSVQQVFTDNAQLSSTDRQSQTQTQILPGLRIGTRDGGRIQLSVDYSLNAPITIGGDRGDQRIQQSLAAALHAEVVERHAALDARAAISQQSLSAFGASVPSGFIGANRDSTEVRSVSISPTLRGSISGQVDVSAQATWGHSSAVSSQASDTSSYGWGLSAGGRLGLLGWSLGHNVSGGGFGAGTRSTATSSTSLALNYSYDYDWRFSVRGGRESSNVQSTNSSALATYGVGVDWTPTPRTSISWQTDERYFGRSHSLSLQHRFRRTVFRVSDSRSESAGNLFLSPIGQANYERLMQELALLIPDPVQRDLRVREFLGQAGGFLTRAVSLQSRRDASLFWSGIRTTVSASVFRTESRRLDTQSTAVDDLSGGARVSQRGESFSASYSLTPTTSMSMSWGRTSSSEIAGSRSTDQQTLQVSLSSAVARNAGLSMSLRHVNVDSPTRPYTENGGTVSLSFSF